MTISYYGSHSIIFGLTLMWPSSKKTLVLYPVEHMTVAYTRVCRHPLGQSCDRSTCHWAVCAKRSDVEDSQCVCVHVSCGVPPSSLLLAKSSSLTVCAVRGLVYTTHLFPVPAWQVLAAGQAFKWCVCVVVVINRHRANISRDNLGHGFRGLCTSSLNRGSRAAQLSAMIQMDCCLLPCLVYWKIFMRNRNACQLYVELNCNIHWLEDL